MTAAPVRTVFLGSGGFGRESLRGLAARPDLVQLVGVVSAPPRPAGRGGPLHATPIQAVAETLDGPVILTPARLRDPDAIAAVLDLAPDLLVLADYGRIVPPALLDVAHGALNLHPSLLPRHRGATPVPATILAGDTETGVTLMRMDAGIDTGPIVAQDRYPLTGRETTPELEAALAQRAAALLEANLGPWLAGARPAQPQDEAGATLTRPLRREDGRLDVARPAAELERRIRALQPWPGSFIDTDAGRLIVWAADAEQDGRAPAAGTFDAHGLGVADGERLRLLEVQPAGGRRMPWADLVRGRPAIVGSSIVT